MSVGDTGCQSLVENVKIQVIGCYSANYYCVSWLSFIKNGFFLAF